MKLSTTTIKCERNSWNNKLTITVIDGVLRLEAELDHKKATKLANAILAEVIATEKRKELAG